VKVKLPGTKKLTFNLSSGGESRRQIVKDIQISIVTIIL
jgi:hypothetical protein